MAEVTLGIGTSHSPMLSTPHEALAGLADLDRARLPAFAARARACAGWIERELRPEVIRARHEATQAAITQLGEVLADEGPDAVIVIGDDQGEWFSPDQQPALCIYWGDTVENLPPPLEKAGCAAPITAGSSTSPAAASTCRTSRRRARSRTRCGRAPTPAAT
jgi:hypothetical protein